MLVYNIKKLKKFYKCICIFNLLLLFSNIILIVFNIKSFYKLSINIFKFSNLFEIDFLKKSFEDISFFLNKKYDSYNNIRQKTKFREKKVIKIKSTGLFNKTFHPIWLKSKLDDEFIINFNDPNPDYLIYNVFRSVDRDPQYKNAIRIAIYTENVMPDINYADYAIGHYHINYLDRYFKYSIIFWQNFTSIDNKRKEILSKPIRKKFCAAVISNCGPKFRMNFIEQLSKYKRVDLGGKCRNNINKIIKNKTEFLSMYKFSIAMENSRGNGYISEKIVHAFMAGTIPIYYGDYIIDEFINPKTFILINGENDIEEKIQYIKKIDNDDELYKSIMKENPIIDNYFINKIDNYELKEFLKNIFRQDKYKAYRRDDNFYNYKCKYNI